MAKYPFRLGLMCKERRRFSQTMASEWQLLLLSLTRCHGVPCSPPSRITTKVLKNCKTFLFFSKTEIKTKTKCSRPRPRLRDPRPRPRPRLSFLSSRRLETKTLVCRTTLTQLNSLNSTGHVTLTAKRDQKKGKKQQLINIPYL